jgi:excisionase family DNA binding protein
MAKEFYTLQEVAQKLGMSRMTIYRYVKAKKLAAYQFGRDFRVRTDDLDTFIASFKV